MNGKAFSDLSETITVGRHTATVTGLAGWRHADGEIDFDDASAARHAEVQDRLVLADRARRQTVFELKDKPGQKQLKHHLRTRKAKAPRLRRGASLRSAERTPELYTG